MQISLEIIGVVIAVSSVITAVAAGVRWLVKHYFDEIKSQFKPNGGSSMRDQVNRLEEGHTKLEQKVDMIYEVLLEFIGRNK